jgi:YjgF/chorismate_mutase-like, putative endoribonuclease
VLRR